MKRIMMTLAVAAMMVPAAALACDGDMKAEATIKTASRPKAKHCEVCFAPLRTVVNVNGFFEIVP